MNGIEEQKYYQPSTVRIRHLAIMEMMLVHPDWDQNRLSAELNYTPSRLSIIINAPLFKLAFAEFRKTYRDKLTDLILEATDSAIRFEKDVVENDKVDLSMRHVAAKTILEQGHVKATERKASLELNTNVPMEDLKGLVGLLEESRLPVIMTRPIRRATELKEVSE